MPEKSEMILLHPNQYLDLEKRTLEKKLGELKLTEKEIEEIRNGHAIKILNDTILGKVPGYKLAKTLLCWNKEVDKEIKNAKKEMLLVNCCSKLNDHGQSIEILKNFISNPAGSTLFNKILQIIDDNPPDPELVQHLSSALLYISQTDFEELFNDHKYALAQIQLMTPHSLTILNDNDNWPPFTLGSFSTNAGVITTEWLEEFSHSYMSSKQVAENAKKLILHCVNELISKRFIRAIMNRERHGQVQLTDIGQTIVRYING
jgi:hypothetical protein